MKNIAMIVNLLQGGGAERCAADLSIYFVEHGFNVIFFTDLSFAVKYEYKGKLVNFTYHLEGSEKEAVVSKVDELRRLKDQYDIDISISFMQFANYVNVLSKGNEKVILTTHSVNHEYAKNQKTVYWAKETFRDLYQYADLITFPSEYCRQEWIAHYDDRNGITRTIYNPVHMMHVHENKDKENIIIAVGRMHSIKRQWHMLRAFKRVKESIADSKLIILGDGELRKPLKDLTDRLGLTDDVEMPGNVTNVQDYLEKSKVFVMTSRMESLGSAALEAMSAGVPVVSCDIPGGIREVLDILGGQVEITEPIRGECGVLVPNIKEFYTDHLTREEEILADEIIRLIKGNQTRLKMGEQAKSRAELFSLEVIGKAWMKEITGIIQRCNIKKQGFNKAKERSLDSIEKLKDNKTGMYISYYRLLDKWLLLREKNISVRQYFQKYEMEHIIIYGMGKMARHLLEDLKGSQVHVVCVIDRNANINSFNSSFPIISDEAEIPGADCIIITPIYDAAPIRQKLEAKTSVPVISLLTIIEECL